MTKKITIAIDAMGGENAPKKNVEGLNIFLKKNKSKKDFVIHLYGNKEKLDPEISKLNIKDDIVKIVHSDGVVSDEETPLTAVKNSKIQVCGILLRLKLMVMLILVYLQEILESFL